MARTKKIAGKNTLIVAQLILFTMNTTAITHLSWWIVFIPMWIELFLYSLAVIVVLSRPSPVKEIEIK